MIKDIALKMMSGGGAFAPFRWITSNDALILMYHRFGRINDGVTVPPEVFAKQVAYLKTHYNVVPLSVIVDHLNAGQKLPRKLAVITVDDGYRDFYEFAFPILRKAGLSATVFLVTDFLSQRAWMPADRAMFIAASAPAGAYQLQIGAETIRFVLGDEASRENAGNLINGALVKLPFERRTPAIARISAECNVSLPSRPPAEFGAMTWEEAREMDRAGIEFGSHTVTHPILTALHRDELDYELRGSREQIEHELRHPIGLISYPHGEVNPAVREATERAGYKAAGSSEPGFNDSSVDKFTIRRIYADIDFPHFVQTTSGCEKIKNQLRNVART